MIYPGQQQQQQQQQQHALGPLPHNPPPHDTTCSPQSPLHAHFDEQYSAAAGFGSHVALAGPTVRLEQLPGAVRGGRGEPAAERPHTLTRGSSSRQGL